jgi:hypothetical protein
MTVKQQLLAGIDKLIIEEQRLHPAAQLQDYYKLLFQAFYGPGHLITDNNSAKKYLIEELEGIEECGSVMLQDLSLGQNDFCRVSLIVIKKGLISVENYLELFIKSANTTYNSHSLKELWPEIELLIGRKMAVSLQQSQELAKNIQSSDSFHPRHSGAYRNAYYPHYRVIKKSLLPQQLLNFLIQ